MQENLKTTRKKEFVKKRAEELNQNLPKSEIWFHNLYEQYRDKNDLNNHPFHNRIPDVINKKYKYIIEIDGSVHDTLKQIKVDKKKNDLFIKSSYCVFRVKAFDEQSFNKFLKYILFIRESNVNHKVMLDWQKLNKVSFNCF